MTAQILFQCSQRSWNIIRDSSCLVRARIKMFFLFRSLISSFEPWNTWFLKRCMRYTWIMIWVDEIKTTQAKHCRVKIERFAGKRRWNHSLPWPKTVIVYWEIYKLLFHAMSEFWMTLLPSGKRLHPIVTFSQYIISWTRTIWCLYDREY